MHIAEELGSVHISVRMSMKCVTHKTLQDQIVGACMKQGRLLTG